MANKSHAGAARGTKGADEKLVRVLEQTAVHKVLEKLEGVLPGIVQESVHESIVHAVHAEPETRSFAPRRGAAKRVSTDVKPPKEGGLCAAVWSELDRLAKKGGTPSLKDILKVGARKGWNENNTRVEYYNWRRAHGISGRVGKPAPAEAAAAH